MNELQRKVIEFRDACDWEQYHNPKDLAISLMLETAELLEVLQCEEATVVGFASQLSTSRAHC